MNRRRVLVGGAEVRVHIQGEYSCVFNQGEAEPKP